MPEGLTPLTAEERAELKRLAEAAAPGPYREEMIDSDICASEYVILADEATVVAYMEHPDFFDDHVSEADLRYIIAACNAVPRLLAQVEALEVAQKEEAQSATD